MSRSRVAGGILVCTLCCGAVLAQTASTHAPGREFEVVSIRENLAPAGGTPSYGPTPDGYHMVNMPLTAAVLTAYVQSNSGTIFSFGNITGLQDLMQMGKYDIDARISDTDRADWQDPKKQPEMLREMLQAMLADRFHLRIHREMKQQDIYLLQVAEGGPKFAEAKPDEAHPGATALPGGGFTGGGNGTEFHYYDLSMPVLASQIGPWAGRPVQDSTGLTGHYDLSFPRPSFANNQSVDPSADAGPSIFTVLAPLGLKLEPAKGQVETLVIDHIEKPSEN